LPWLPYDVITKCKKKWKISVKTYVMIALFFVELLKKISASPVQIGKQPMRFLKCHLAFSNFDSQLNLLFFVRFCLNRLILIEQNNKRIKKL